ncbi:hypothetical protein [Arenibaculum pallidiluteum]|uniref:hypothetical protein n=1 Tax=Arenibaculum pallidiluteum TaxID=2812559 RepID=UPI001A96B34A|nr:hypothetical protein [Arenibaculum pallidiluteum]
MSPIRTALLLTALLLGQAPPWAESAAAAGGSEEGSENLFVPVDRMRLILVGPDERIVGSLQFDMMIEAKNVVAREKITLLMPRIRDAILTRLAAQPVTGRALNAEQISEAKRRIVTLVEQTVGKATVSGVQMVKSYIQPV